MKVSIITVVYNNIHSIGQAIESVLNQTYKNIEYIIIDGNSTDGTDCVINKYLDNISLYVKENDKGIYDAMNKGIKLAKGDVIGILNSDDFYISTDVIRKVVEIFKKRNIDSLFADLLIVNRDDTEKVIRYYRANQFQLSNFSKGLMPPHPTFFVKRKCYHDYGLFNTSYRIAADFELMLRFLLKNKITYVYLPESIIKMRVGGLSTKNIASNIRLNNEILKACKDNNINTNLFKIYSKYFLKLRQYITRPR
jgi:glycosyltransferase involved in cell wall biosynthesis